MKTPNIFNEVVPHIDGAKHIIDISGDTSLCLDALSAHRKVLSLRSSTLPSSNTAQDELDTELIALMAQFGGQYQVMKTDLHNPFNIQSQMRAQYNEFINPQSAVVTIHPETKFNLNTIESREKFTNLLVSMQYIVPNQLLVTHQMLAPMFCSVYTEYGIQGVKYKLPSNQVLLKSVRT